MDEQYHEKENVNPEKTPGRRDSLARGILKYRNETDNNLTVPIRDPKVGRLSLGAKESYKRRVSFAPEVTLHKIDLIPQSLYEDDQRPRRRETIAVVPHTPRQMAPVALYKEKQEGTEPDILYDSSDIEMEDDSHVYSSPRRALAFKIHEDGQDDGHVQQDDEDSTMDLTKPLGNIQQMAQYELPLEHNTEEGQGDSKYSEKSRPFGAITSLFSDEDEDEEDDGEEVEMELTQPLSQQEKSDLEDLGNNSTIEMPMDISEADATADDESMVESTMISIGTDDPITKKNTLLNRKINTTPEVEDQIMNMDQTRTLGSITHHQDDYMELTMDQTNMLDGSIQQQSVTPVNVMRGTVTPLKTIRSHTSVTGSPISSKRKYVDDDNVTMDLRAKLNSITPKKKPAIKDSLQGRQSSIVPFETVSSVLSSQVSSQDELKSSFTPLRSSTQSSRKSLSSTKIEFSLTQKVPLAPSHENGENSEPVPEEYEPVSLDQFIGDLSIEFFDDLNINEDFTAEIQPLSNPKSANLLDFIIAKNVKVPWLELYSFSCDELQKNMNELKLLFDNLSDEFADENPRIVREYYETSSLKQQKKLGDHLIQMKQYSDHQAEISWYSWREKLLDELQLRLDKNLGSLKSDCDVLNDLLVQADELCESLKEENLILESNIESLETKKRLYESSERESLIQTRKRLLNEVNELESAKAEEKTLQLQLEKLESGLFDTSSMEETVNQKRDLVARYTEDPYSRVLRLASNFRILGSVTGLKLKSLQGSTLKMVTNSKMELSYNFSTDEKELELPETASDITRVYLTKFDDKNKSLEFSQYLKQSAALYNRIIQLEEDLYQMGLFWPTSMRRSDNGIQVFLSIFNKRLRYKYKMTLNFTNEDIMTSSSPSTTSVDVIYGQVDSNMIFDEFESIFPDNYFLRGIKDHTITTTCSI
ncbi:spc7 [Cyberlindnera jadinii]|uniref:Spc7 protein n=1 Tax=Cyberlindnera jadinii (strain ATCC 18201 / CBS 1600 / BCRC 20928 / JCM 3617 / NBRC 0987 / NRRL Y-1542) TaxID=983966 RepID=A0A0H5C7N5_CYBJN|nr:spc7 [Cyberlindnera jadinii]